MCRVSLCKAESGHEGGFMTLQDVNIFSLIECVCSLHSADVPALIYPAVFLPSAVLTQC